MSLAEKIAIAGNTLEQNLISKGVDCTFGRGSEGKDTITDMAEMVTQLGNKTELFIVPSSKYVVINESFVLSVLLCQGGQSLPNKQVSVSNGTTVYYGTTNNNGVASFNIESISKDTTFTATYEDLSATCTIELVLFYDSGLITTGLSNDYYVIPDGCYRELTNNGMEISTNLNSSHYLYPNVQISGDFELSFKFQRLTSAYFQFDLKPTTLSTTERMLYYLITDSTNIHEVRIIRQGENIQCYLDNNRKDANIDTINHTDDIYFAPNLYQASGSTLIKHLLKDIKIKAINSLHLYSSSEYVVEDEEFTLTVQLSGNDISNKTINITGSDDSNYTLTTNSSGVATKTIDSISSDVTYTASYENLNSSITIERALFVDYGVTGKKNSNWTNPSDRMSIVTNEESTLLTPTNNTNQTYFCDYLMSMDNDYIIKMDLKKYGIVTLGVGNTISYNVDANSYFTLNITNDEYHQLEIRIQNNEITFNVDGEVLGNLTRNYYKYFFFRINGTELNRSINYKNFRIKTL